jgi:hypothetical protein
MGSNVNENFLTNESKWLNGKHTGRQQSNKPRKKLFVQRCQNSDIKKVNSWPAGSQLIMQVFASLQNIPASSPEFPLSVGIVSELCLEACANVFMRDTLLGEKRNDGSMVGLDPLIEKP